MVDASNSRRSSYCDGITRRSFMQVGAFGLGGLTLPHLLAAKASGAPFTEYVRDKSIVLLFLSGGPSHIEFFDPKMSAPVEVHSVTGEVQTKIPGVTFGGTFPKLASMTDRFTVVRDYGSKNSDHTYEKVSSGMNPLKAAMSAIYARVAGNNNPRTGIPNNILVLPEAVKTGLKLQSNFETGALNTLTDPGMLGKSYAAFDSSGGSTLKENMELRIAPERLGNRRQLLANLDRLRMSAERGGMLDRVDVYRQQAFEMITRGIAQSLDLSKEDPATLAAYDTTGIFKAADLQQWYDMRRTTNLLGHQLLLARRMCEAGCGFVTVSDCGWDMHANGNSPRGMSGIWPMGQQVDHAVAAFLEDVHQRGLSDKIMLIVTGEMGRSPRINKDGGRDHYGDLTPLLIAGGGLKMGQVIGSSDRTAAKPNGEGHRPEHLLGTVMNTLFDVPQLRLDPAIPRDVSNLITSSEPIRSLGI